MTTLALFGSTGSIGVNTLDVVRDNPHEFRVRYLTSNNNVLRLCDQAEEFHPAAVAVMDRDAAAEARRRLGPAVEVLSGSDGLLSCVRRGRRSTECPMTTFM